MRVYIYSHSYLVVCETHLIVVGNGAVINDSLLDVFAAEDITDVDVGICGWILTVISWIIVFCTLPFSLFVCFKVFICNAL
jgi:hypothetical protein